MAAEEGSPACPAAADGDTHFAEADSERDPAVSLIDLARRRVSVCAYLACSTIMIVISTVLVLASIRMAL